MIAQGGNEDSRTIDRRLIASDIIEDRTSEASIDALERHLAPALIEVGFASDTGDRQVLRAPVRLAHRIMRCVANRPFVTQEQISRELDVDAEQLRALNRALRLSPLAQELMLNAGHGAKYLANTVLPMIRSGSVADALNGIPSYPRRVGVYTGQSCMFHCTFCGRDPDARYRPSSVQPGNIMLREMFTKAPKDDPHRFYLSGGLEPLTNKGLGELVDHGAGEGLHLSLYTNGYLLDERLLTQQPGLWRLGSLRISLYGVDQSSTLRVTGRNKAFDRVVQNAESFLRLRNERGSDLQFGFNFVLLAGRSDQLTELGELIARLNRRVGGRQIDFLTLREDYSVAPDDGIGRAEREDLLATIERFEQRRLQPDLRDVNVDYGYSLESLRRGVIGPPLEMATHTDMRPTAYPQISVVVDLLGDVYAYREAGFLDRHGADRYIIGRMDDERGLHDVVREFVESGRELAPRPGDTCFFDSYDHVVTRLLNQAVGDQEFGVPFDDGPLLERALSGRPSVTAGDFVNAHFVNAHGAKVQ